MRLRNLFAVVMLFGIYSLLSAAIFVSLDAMDVAFTEAAVGAGISTILALSTLALTARHEKKAKILGQRLHIERGPLNRVLQEKQLKPKPHSRRKSLGDRDSDALARVQPKISDAGGSSEYWLETRIMTGSGIWILAVK